jgi:hypothetical protein
MTDLMPVLKILSFSAACSLRQLLLNSYFTIIKFHDRSVPDTQTTHFTTHLFALAFGGRFHYQLHEVPKTGEDHPGGRHFVSLSSEHLTHCRLAIDPSRV